MDAGKLLIGATVGMVVLAVVLVAFVVVDPSLPGSGGVDALEDGDLPDGITSDGVQNATAAARDHRESLSGRPFTIRLQATRTTQDGDGELQLEQTIRSDGDGNVAVRSEQSGTQSFTVSAWTNGSVAVQRNQRADRTDYRRLQPSAVSDDASAWVTIRQVLAAGQFEPTEVKTEDGQQLVVLSAEEPTENAAGAFGVESVSSFSGTVTVGADGVVHSMDVQFSFTNSRGQQITQELRHQITDLDATTVERPGWVQEALSATDSNSDSGERLVPAGTSGVR